MKRYVIGKVSVEGFHYYPYPPKEVEFLADKHRHTFNIKFVYGVTHQNREVEIFIVRKSVREFLRDQFADPKDRCEPLEFGAMSCEMIASYILENFRSEGMIECEVWEENTGGGKAAI